MLRQGLRELCTLRSIADAAINGDRGFHPPADSNFGRTAVRQVAKNGAVYLLSHPYSVGIQHAGQAVAA